MMVSMLFIRMTRAMASARRVREVMEEVPDISDTEAAHPELTVREGSVELRHVSFRYYKDSAERVLDDINLNIPAGSTVGIIGSTGSGKSTLVPLIPRLYDADEGGAGGRCQRKGLEPAQSACRHRHGSAKECAVLRHRPGQPALGDENADDETLRRAARDAQADGFVSAFPEGYSHDIEQGGTNVSGGQKQRLCIARALLAKPKILIPDDSTSAVDTATEARIRQALRGELRDATKIIIAQRILSVMDADCIVVLNEGRVTGMGTHAELLENNRSTGKFTIPRWNPPPAPCRQTRRLPPHGRHGNGRRRPQMAKRSPEELRNGTPAPPRRTADAVRRYARSRSPAPHGRGRQGKYSRATVQRLLSYIAVYRGRIIPALVFMVINTLTALAGTFLLRDVINVVNPRNTDPAKSTVVRLFMPWITQDNFAQQRLNCLVMVAAVLAVVYLVGILTNYLQNRLMVTVSQNATERLRNDLFRKLQHLPVRYFDANTTGELMSRFTNDIDAIDNMINSTVTSLISGAISLVGTLIMMLYLNIRLTLITLAFIPLFLFSGKAIAKRPDAITAPSRRHSAPSTVTLRNRSAAPRWSRYSTTRASALRSSSHSITICARSSSARSSTAALGPPL